MTSKPYRLTIELPPHVAAQYVQQCATVCLPPKLAALCILAEWAALAPRDACLGLAHGFQLQLPVEG